MSKDPKFKTVANAIRIEVDKTTDDVFIIFKITDLQFKQKVRESWADDIELELINKSLKIKGN